MAHAHGHGATTSPLRIALGITVALFVAEVVGAAVTGSLALIADAGHLATDVLGLGAALLAASLAARPATDRRTYGFARTEVLAATAQAAVLLAVGLFVLVEGVERLLAPPTVPAGPLLLFGLLALAGNGASIAVLARGRRRDLNLRAAFLEVLSDALGGLAVVLAAVVIAVTGWLQADAAVAIALGVLVLPRTGLLLRDAVNVLLESAPPGLDLAAVREHLVQQPHVLRVHDLHASLISSALPVLSAHVVIDEECFRDGRAPEVLDLLQRCVAEHFPVQIEHSTFQLEPPAHAGHESPTHA